MKTLFAIAATFALLGSTAALAAGDATGAAWLKKLAGWEGIICGGSAIYLAMAEVINEHFGEKVLPIG